MSIRTAARLILGYAALVESGAAMGVAAATEARMAASSRPQQECVRVAWSRAHLGVREAFIVLGPRGREDEHAARSCIRLGRCLRGCQTAARSAATGMRCQGGAQQRASGVVFEPVDVIVQAAADLQGPR